MDIEDDMKEDMPNVFVIAAIEDIPYKIIKILALVSSISH